MARRLHQTTAPKQLVADHRMTLIAMAHQLESHNQHPVRAAAARRAANPDFEPLPGDAECLCEWRHVIDHYRRHNQLDTTRRQTTAARLEALDWVLEGRPEPAGDDD